MMKNEKGFSVIEILFIVVVVGLIGTVSWLVYDRQKSKTNDKVATSQTSQNNDAQELTKKQTIPEGWKKYENKKYSFEFYYPSSAKLTEREDINSNSGELNYFSVDVSVDSGNNPQLNVYANGNYKIQTQVTTNKNLIDYLSSFEYDTKVETSNGLSRAKYTDLDTGGPPYNTYYIAKGKTILAISLIGDVPFSESTIIDTFAFVN